MWYPLDLFPTFDEEERTGAKPHLCCKMLSPSPVIFFSHSTYPIKDLAEKIFY